MARDPVPRPFASGEAAMLAAAAAAAGERKMPPGTRLPSWKERENNKRRERRRRAIAAKIFAGLRMYGNYKLPKHCDNNEVLKAVCDEAGWVVDADGTTYRKGCKRPEQVDVPGCSVCPSPCASYQPSPCGSYNPSPCASYNPSPASSSFPSPRRPSYVDNSTNVNNPQAGGIDPSLIPWLKNISTASPAKRQHIYIPGGSISAPVTPPLTSPTARTPRVKLDREDPAVRPLWAAAANYTSLPSSTPPSPGRVIAIPAAGWFAGLNIPAGGSPPSPTYNLVAGSNPFGNFYWDDASACGGGSSSKLWTPVASGTCSPALINVEAQMSGGGSGAASEEFAFGSSSSNNSSNNQATDHVGVVKPWEGETIHEECGSDDLELTLGCSRSTKADVQ